MKSPQETNRSATAKSQDKPLLARRAIIKGAVGTLPTILTLQSGAALARSSNLIGTSTNAKDAYGRTLCLSELSSEGVYGDKVDLGPSGSGYVTAITERDYYSEPNMGSTPVLEESMCTTGDVAYFKNMGWYSKQAPKGYLVSANAISSFANIEITEI